VPPESANGIEVRARLAVVVDPLTIHWAGAKHPLNRGFDGGLAEEDLAAEELVAEIGAAYLCADLAVSNTPRSDHAAYVASWLKVLKNDKRAIFHASRLADRAVTLLHELAVASDQGTRSLLQGGCFADRWRVAADPQLNPGAPPLAAIQAGKFSRPAGRIPAFMCRTDRGPPL
jgi:hypothetical protein